MAWGGVISGALYIGATLTLLVAIGKNDISVLQGIVQAVSHMAGRVGMAWVTVPFALLLGAVFWWRNDPRSDQIRRFDH